MYAAFNRVGRPGVVANDGTLIVDVRLAVLVRIHEEVRIGSSIVQDWGALFLGVSLDAGIQHLGEGIDLSGNAFGDIAIAIVVGGVHAVGLRVIGVRGAAVAGGAGFQLDFQSVYVMAILALVDWVLDILPNILLTFVLVSALDIVAEDGRAGSEVVDVREADRSDRASRDPFQPEPC